MENFIVPLASSEAANAELFGPKAANQAALGLAGLPIPAGFCVSAGAYRQQLRDIDLESAITKLATTEDLRETRLLCNEVRLGLFKEPISSALQDALLAARQDLVSSTGQPIVVRSSALVEDREGSSFAGQFESFLGLEEEKDFITAVRACWAALWSNRALRYMSTHSISPHDTAMGLLVQPLIFAKSAGGGLSKTADGGMLLNATWGLGEAIAQGEVVPDRYELDADGGIVRIVAGRKTHQVGCQHHQPSSKSVASELIEEPCLDEDQVVVLGKLLKQAEAVIDVPAEIEWVLDENGFKLLQVRPLQMEEATVPDEIWLRHPGLRGHPGGIGWGQGRACVINCECELSRVGPGDVLVTRVAGPSLSQILPKVSGVVAELGGSTSHLASLARERRIPMVLGVLDATENIPEGAKVAVDGVAGIVRWIND